MKLIMKLLNLIEIIYMEEIHSLTRILIVFKHEFIFIYLNNKLYNFFNDLIIEEKERILLEIL